MIIPMRCFTCGTPLSNIRDKYLQLVLQNSNSSSLIEEDRIYRVTEENMKQDIAERKALDELGLNKYCCRRVMLTHTDVVAILN